MTTFEVTSSNRHDREEISTEFPTADIEVLDGQTFNVSVTNSYVDELVDYLDESLLDYRMV